MTPRLAVRAIEACFRAKQPVFIKGSPGVGKSSIIMQIAEKMGWEIRDVRAVQMDPVDIRGLPYVSADKRSHWAVPEFFPNEGKGVFFVDELTSAPQMVQAAFYQLVLDRKLGEYRLPDGWVIAAAGNKETDRGVTFRMPTPLRNRFTHIELEPSLEDWLLWAEKAQIRPEIMSFLKFDSGALCQFEKDQDAFSTPRTWHFLSKILDAQPEEGETEYSLISGTVGPASAAKFKAHLKMFRELPSYDQIIRTPDKTKIPTSGSAQYAVALMVSRRIDNKTIDKAAVYIARMAPELAVMVYKTAHDRDETIGKTKEFIKFALDHKVELMGVN